MPAEEKLPKENPTPIIPGNLPIFRSDPYMNMRPPLPPNQIMTPNGQLNCIRYNSSPYMEGAISNPFTPHFRPPATVIPRPIFNRCAMHAGIAYFIHSIKKREVFF